MTVIILQALEIPAPGQLTAMVVAATRALNLARRESRPAVLAVDPRVSVKVIHG